MGIIDGLNNLFFKGKPVPSNNGLSAQEINAYNLKRVSNRKKSFCHAPSLNLYFSWEGKVIACCFNQQFILGNYPEQSIREIWEGPEIKKLRESLKSYDLSNGCGTCFRDLKNSQFKDSNALRFDEFTPAEFPKMMEFQLTNTCNLACNMCNGWLSSTIRKNREQLPALPMKYDTEFVEQLTEFIPHLEFTNFSGGEPFLIEIYYDIWEKIIALNPKCIIKITTNGTVFNNRVKRLLNAGCFDITLSLDSLNKDIYESIRIGASYDRVIEHIHAFSDYCNKKESILNINFCPMVDNWHEIPAFLTFCNSIGASIYFSIVHYPWNRSIKSLSSTKLVQIIEQIDLELESANLPKNRNYKEWERLKDQINSWKHEKINRDEERSISMDELKNLVTQKLNDSQTTHKENSQTEFQVELDKLHQLIHHKNMNLLPLYEKIEKMSPNDLLSFFRSNEMERKDLFSEYIIINQD